MKKYPIKTEYYDRFDCDFDGGSFKERRIDESYKYEEKGFFYKTVRFLVYRVVIAPIALLHTFVLSKNSFHGKELLKPYKRTGYFVYSNHTDPIGDAFMPNALLYPKRASIVVSAKNFEIPVIGRFLKHLGAIPVPNDRSAAIGFSREIKRRIEDGGAVVIYPEAHLWPYSTMLRPFDNASFSYPVRLDTPVFTLTRTYKKTKRSYRCVIYIDGPFFPDESLSHGEAKERLFRETRAVMEARCALSDIDIVKYEERK